MERRHYLPEAPQTVPDLPVIRATKKQKAIHHLRVDYQRKQQDELKPQKHFYYRVVLSDGDSKQGRLDAKGQAYFPDVPVGPVKVYYGLTQKDADKAGQSALQNEHQQKVAAFIKMLDGIIAKVKGRAAKQKAELQKHGTFGKGWMYTEFCQRRCLRHLGLSHRHSRSSQRCDCCCGRCRMCNRQYDVGSDQSWECRPN